MAGGKKRKSYQVSHTPEWEIARFAADADAQDPNRRFFVYLLDTSYGTYVGHSHDVQKRLREHKSGRSVSTRGGKPVFLWSSEAFNTREEVLLFETRLKDLRDTQNPEFVAITGVQPIPFDTPRLRKRVNNLGRTSSRHPFATPRIRKRAGYRYRTLTPPRHRSSLDEESTSASDSTIVLLRVIAVTFFLLLVFILVADVVVS